MARIEAVERVEDVRGGHSKSRSGRPAVRRGTTLLEVLVGCGIFAFLVIATVAILNLGTGSYRSIQGKADVVRQLNRFEADIVQELKRASLATVGIYTPSTDYHWAIWFKTAMNSPDNVDSSGNPLTPLGDPIEPITYLGSPVLQRYVLYYVQRMDETVHEDTYGYVCGSYSSSSGPDTVCPHKWIVKKDLYLTNPNTGNDMIGLQTSSTAYTNIASLVSDSGASPITAQNLIAEGENSAFPGVHRVQIVAQDVLSFEVTRLAVNPSSPTSQPTVSASGPIILFDVKVMKDILTGKASLGQSSAPEATVSSSPVSVPSSTPMNMVNVVDETDASGNTLVHTQSTVTPAYESFTVQIDNRVIPENT